jgi:putative membrane protein
MMMSWLIASLHLLALPLGLGGVWIRGRALSETPDAAALRRAFAAADAWGAALVVWIVTGAWRTFGDAEKGMTYYFSQPTFHLKLGLVAIVILLELWPMTTLIRWRFALKRGETVATAAAPIIVLIGRVQAAIVLVILFAATALARGAFAR